LAGLAFHVQRMGLVQQWSVRPISDLLVCIGTTVRPVRSEAPQTGLRLREYHRLGARQMGPRPLDHRRAHLAFPGFLVDLAESVFPAMGLSALCL
jgi:hypothetical protein